MDLVHARRRARDMLGRIRAGENPADDIKREKEAPTFRAFAGQYLRRCDPHWKPSGRETVRIYLKARILTAFGRMPLQRIGPVDVAAWFDAVSRDKPGAANRAFEILHAMMFRAEEWGLRERGANPCLGIARNPGNHIARFLDTDELARRGRALDAREARWPVAVAAVRLLALTGCRRGEVLNPRWRDIGEDAVKLRDAKTGGRVVPLGPEARAILSSLPREEGNPWVISGRLPGSHLTDLQRPWRRVRKRARLEDVRIHNLRHSFASRALALGESLTMIGKLLGHTQVQTTARYAHLARDSIQTAAARITGSIGGNLMGAHEADLPHNDG